MCGKWTTSKKQDKCTSTQQMNSLISYIFNLTKNCTQGSRKQFMPGKTHMLNTHIAHPCILQNKVRGECPEGRHDQQWLDQPTDGCGTKAMNHLKTQKKLLAFEWEHYAPCAAMKLHSKQPGLESEVTLTWSVYPGAHGGTMPSVWVAT